ncbi:hypothetical protein [Fulvimonas yonginensis]|uniref:YD repeat-containing protein n=1 Tax=Fulvimonas yonginensis TaxID=1495200 RepID=A0ABU8JCP5_9GAMM
MRLSIVPLLGLACLLASPPSPAGVRHGASVHRTHAGGIARTHGTLATGPDGRRAWHAGGTTVGGDGSVSHVRAGGVSGPDGRAVGGRRTTVGNDGTIARRSGYVVQGANGGTMQGGRRVQRGPDGTLQAGYAASGQRADGGSYSRSGSRTRTADGERMASRQTLASGARGSYQGSTTRAGGTLSHDSSISGATGNSYQGQTSYTRGEGLSHTGTCTDAQGHTFDCR